MKTTQKVKNYVHNLNFSRTVDEKVFKRAQINKHVSVNYYQLAFIILVEKDDIFTEKIP